ncbi:hypothetical protein [Anabaena sp. CCY 9910]
MRNLWQIYTESLIAILKSRERDLKQDYENVQQVSFTINDGGDR